MAVQFDVERSTRRITWPVAIPLTTILLLVAVWVIFVLESVQASGSESILVLFGFGGTTSTTFAAGELWRLVASCFVHRGLVHILGNSLLLLLLGPVAERLYGPSRYLGLYVGSGIGGAVATVVLAGRGR